MATLELIDAESLADLGRFASRARALTPTEAAIRLQAQGPVLAAWVCVVPGQGLLGDGVTLGLRTMALAEPATLDVTVPLAAVCDRTARPGVGSTLAVPPMEQPVHWSALTPPRSGWEPVGEVGSDWLAERTRDLVKAEPERALDAVLTSPEVSIQGRGAWAAYGLGFLASGGTVTVWRTQRWTRLSTPGGHVLMR